MDAMRDLPMGFGMALFENQTSASYFEALSPMQQQAVLDQTHEIRSKKEMKAFVEHLPHSGF